jgi:hypothetical protein
MSVPLSLDRIRGVLADADLEVMDRAQVEQVFAGDSDEMIEKVESRSLSNIAGLSELAFHEGLRALRQDADDGIITGPVLEPGLAVLTCRIVEPDDWWRAPRADVVRARPRRGSSQAHPAPSTPTDTRSRTSARPRTRTAPCALATARADWY